MHTLLVRSTIALCARGTWNLRRRCAVEQWHHRRERSAYATDTPCMRRDISRRTDRANTAQAWRTWRM